MGAIGHGSLRARRRKLGLPARLRDKCEQIRGGVIFGGRRFRYATEGGARDGETRSRAGATGMRRSTNVQACFDAKIKSTNGIWRAAKYARSAAQSASGGGANQAMVVGMTLGSRRFALLERVRATIGANQRRPELLSSMRPEAGLTGDNPACRDRQKRETHDRQRDEGPRGPLLSQRQPSSSLLWPSSIAFLPSPFSMWTKTLTGLQHACLSRARFDS